MKHSLFYTALVALTFFTSCKGTPPKATISIKNPLDSARQLETVEVKISDLKLSPEDAIADLSVQDVATKAILVSQLVDEDQDGTADVLLFQPELEPNATKAYALVKVPTSEQPKVTEYCYSRFVPERTDDYAWENNKVGFRTFGPVAQQMIEEGVKGGTLSSGIDAWLKRVEYPIINKWYKKAETEKGAYHKDTGEGLDNFHVGVSRGVGGIAVKADTTYYVSKNFTAWKTITTGPLRTSFVLEYANWDAKGKTISETKHIALDYGSNLSRFEIEVSGTDTIHAGLTLHEKDGTHTINKTSGWVSYWEPHDGSELGTAIIVPNGNLISGVLYDTPLKDKSNVFAQIKVENNKAVYYAGFGWKKANEFTTKAAWEEYLASFATKLNNPLVVTIN